MSAVSGTHGHGDHGDHGGHDHAGDDHAGHDHAKHDHGGEGHNHAPKVTSSNERVVLIGFVLTALFMVAELVGGVLSGSLALIADAGHMLTDSVALALAWAGFHFGSKASNSQKTFGYLRLEVVAGFVNAVSLFVLVLWILYEAVMRLFTPHPVLAGPMMIVAVLGLVVNIGVFYILQQGDKDHINIRGAMLHVVGDMAGSVAAIVAAVIIYFTGWTPIDPILSVVLSALILRGAWHLMANSLHILMEGTPANVDIAALKLHLLQTVPGLVSVDHVHVWSITSGKASATMEVSIAPETEPGGVTRAIKDELARKFEVGHTTIEIVWDSAKSSCPLGSESGQSTGHVGHAH